MKAYISALSLLLLLPSMGQAQWVPTNGPWTGNIRALASSGSKLFAGTDRGVFLSTDTATTWTFASAGLPTLPYVRSIAATDGVLLAGTDYGVFRSTNNGANWATANNGLPDSSVNQLIAVGTNVYARINNSSYFLSQDEGITWVAIAGPSPASYYSYVVSGSNVFATLGGKVLRSTDNGGDWIPLKDSAFSYQEVRALGIMETNLFVGIYDAVGYSGVYRSTDSGSTWVSASSGIPANTLTGSNTFISSLIVSGENILVGTDDGIFLSTDSGANWKTASAGIAKPQIYTLSGGTNLFAGTDPSFSYFGPGLFFSNDGGEHWTLIDVDGSVTDPATDSILWKLRLDVHAFALSGTDLFAATDSGLYLSEDSGTNWKKISHGVTNTKITSLATNGTNLFAGNKDSIFLSTDKGSSWTTASTGATSPPYVTALVMHGNKLFAATLGRGVFLSTDNGISWDSVNTGFPKRVHVRALAISDSNLYAAIADSGVWHRPISEMNPASAAVASQTVLRKIQSYPNPFSQSTTISFSSPESGAAEVTIVNLLGSEVARLFEGTLAAGEHIFTWDARGVAPGVYECVVRMNGRVERVPMVRLP